MLKGEFGIIGPQLKEAAWGRDDTPLVPYHQGSEVKSMGHEVTLGEDSADPAFLHGTLLRLSDQVARRLRAEAYVGRTVVLKLRNHRFETCTRQRALAEHTSDHERIYATIRALFDQNWKGGPVRLLGVSVTSLEKLGAGAQSELFDHDDRRRRLVEAADRVRDRLGEASLVPLGSLTHRGGLRHVPFGAMSGRVLQKNQAAEKKTDG
jgi:hypothetical protein